MFAVVNSYTRAAQFKGLSAESSYRLQRVGGNVLGMLNLCFGFGDCPAGGWGNLFS